MSTLPAVDKSVRLMSFLKEYVQLRSRVVKNVESYSRDGAVKWFSNLPRTQGCASPAWHGTVDDGVWLQVQKQQLPDPPEVPSLLREWVEGAGDPEEEPTLKEVIYRATEPVAGAEEALEPHTLDEHPNVQEAWPAYLDRWTPWATEYKRRAQIRHLYFDLFKMYEAVSERPEELELLVGLGLFVDGKADVKRHFVEAKAELVFDKVKGMLTLKGAESAVGAEVRLEDEFTDRRPQPEHYTDITQELADVGHVIWNNSDLEQALIGWANALNVDYEAGLNSPSGAKPEATLFFAPAIILRKRTVKGQVKMIEAMIQHCTTHEDVPRGLSRLVETGDTHAQTWQDIAGFRHPADGGGQPEELYFPLPSNDAQTRIVQRLAGQQGVLVQGPPGTGKSHTIANLICHLLASGKRVLVTSETPKALAVLKAKLPDALKPLCVSAVSERDASGELNTAVNNMVQRHASYDRASQEDTLRELAKDLDACRRRGAAAYKKLLELREAETHSVTLPGGNYSGTAATIARRVSADADTLGWLRDVSLLSDEPPLDDSQAAELADLLEAYSDDRVRDLRRAVPVVEALPTPEKFHHLVGTEEEATATWSAFQALADDPGLQALLTLNEERRSDLAQAAEAADAALRDVDARSEPWLPRLLADLNANRPSSWSALREQTSLVLNDSQLAGEAHVGDSVEVILPPDKDEATVLDDATALWRHLHNGGTWNVLGLFPAGPVKTRTYLRKSVRVNNQAADTAQRLDELVTHLTAKRKLAGIWAQWERCGATRPATFQNQRAALKDNLYVLSLVWQGQDTSQALSRVLKDAGLPDLSDGTAPEVLTHLLEGADARLRLADQRRVFEQLLGSVTAVASAVDAHPLVQQLATAIGARDGADYERTHAHLVAVAGHRERLERLADLTARVEAAAPKLLERLQASDPADRKKQLTHLEGAWRWGQAQAWLAERQQPGLLARVSADYREAKAEEAELLAALAAEQAWKHFMERLSNTQRKHLMAWKDAVSKIPKSPTAKSYPKFARAAKEHMEACIPAVPAWIMPRFKLAETLTVMPEMFDVVIVDEASQTGIDGLTLPFLAKQVVVVGDDKQISPSGIGIPEDAVNALVAKHLADNPFKTMFTPKHSLYDHAGVHYGERIPLQEHFRCMPEIIEFSNQLCYAPDGIPLTALRNYPPDRLDPVKASYVKAGYQKASGQKVQNPPEAEAIVEQVVACDNDARYDGLSFGVVSLLGGAQAELLHDLLLDRLGPETVEARRLVCGDAYAFQGDERDVIFLSLVSAPSEGKVIRALTAPADVQRFNVAASRAKDQMWLFHSALPEHLSLNPQCVRRRLLDYFMNPAAFLQTASGIDLPELRRAAHSKPRPTNAPKPFDSWFEVDVFLDLAERGFHVVPQVKFAGYRIDLVVEGNLGRLAVECDGDYWHGPEQFERDMARQRQLERAGWQFWRIRSSEYYFNRAEVLNELWDELARRGIDPAGLDKHKGAPVDLHVTDSGVEASDSHQPDAAPPDKGELETGVASIEHVQDAPSMPLEKADEITTDLPTAIAVGSQPNLSELLLAVLEPMGEANWDDVAGRCAARFAEAGFGLKQSDLRQAVRERERDGVVKLERIKLAGGAQKWGRVRLTREESAHEATPPPNTMPSTPRNAGAVAPKSPPTHSALAAGTHVVSESNAAYPLQHEQLPDPVRVQPLAAKILERVRKKGAVDIGRLHKRFFRADDLETLEERESLFESALQALVAAGDVVVAMRHDSLDPMSATVYLPGLIESVQAVPSEVWLGLANWAKENGKFRPWERSILYDVGKYLQTVTPKQAAHAQRLYQQALEDGYLGGSEHTGKTLN